MSETHHLGVVEDRDILSRRFSDDLAALHDTLRMLLEHRRTLECDLQIQYSKERYLVS